MFTPQGIHQLQEELGRDLVAFLPELILCAGIVLFLLLRLFRAFDRAHLGWVALALSAVALLVAVGQWRGEFGLITPGEFTFNRLDMFTGLLVYDNFTIFLRIFLLF